MSFEQEKLEILKKVPMELKKIISKEHFLKVKKEMSLKNGWPEGVWN